MEKFAGIRNQRAANRISKAGGKGLVLPTRGGGVVPPPPVTKNVVATTGQSWLFQTVGANADETQGTFSGWFNYADLQPGSLIYLLASTNATGGGVRYSLNRGANNAQFYTGVTSGGTGSFNATSNIFPTAAGTWGHIAVAVDTVAQVVQMYINGVDAITGGTSAWTGPYQLRLVTGVLANTFSGANAFIGKCGELWWDTRFVDLDNGGISAFYVGGDTPAADLGPRGQNPTTFIPRYFFGGDMTAVTGGFGNGGVSIDNTGWNGGCNNGSDAMEKGGVQPFTDSVP
jgi:hypothetical protein